MFEYLMNLIYIVFMGFSEVILQEERDTSHSLCVYVYQMLDHYSNGPHRSCCQVKFYLEGYTSSIRELCNFPSVWFWLCLDVVFNCISNFKFGGGSIFVPSLSMPSPSLFDDNLEY